MAWSRPRLFHALALLHHAVAIWWLVRPKDLAGVTEPTTLNLQRYPCRFFTGWNLVAQTSFLCACVFEDLRGDRQSRLAPHVARLADLVFWALVFPGTIFVGSVFWTLYTLDRELVYPTPIDAVLPRWLNHAMHTDIAAVLAAGMCRPRAPPPRPLALAALLAYIACYDCVFLHAYTDGNVWIYPVFAELGPWPRQLGFLALANAAILALYFLGDSIGKKLWGASPAGWKCFQKSDEKQNGLIENHKVK
ncbi:androgen-dependent TFPI-regulating protein-like [Bacillus rossius redtenbacheri]|uniref:androgen-dependent TFPI-regulating protein-like n=1 Tax=Bacillus rossius redtenbacheri TaxID=93214 RepID=UPI002FDDB06A